MSHKNFGLFLESWSAELSAQAQRVRLLIGDAHWLSDGNHKEVILRSFLSRYLPGSLKVGTGFALNPESMDRLTRQQDVIIADLSVGAPYLIEDSFIIVPAAAVLGYIEVKSALSAAVVNNALKNVLHSSFVLSNRLRPPWRGIVFFSNETISCDLFHKWVCSALKSTPIEYMDPMSIPICIISVGNFIAFLEFNDSLAIRLRILSTKDKSLAYGLLDLYSSISQKFSGVKDSQFETLANAEFTDNPIIYQITI